MLVTTATLAARTPAAPLMPQNHGVGPVLIAETNRMPVGNPKPIRKPAITSAGCLNYPCRTPPRAVLDKFAAIQMLDVHFPTTDRRTLILSRRTELTADQKLLVQQLK